jgi:hypothetical protein
MDKYFDDDKQLTFKLSPPCRKSSFITELRKYGDTKNQYVVNIRYLDTLEFSYDCDEIYSIYNDSDPVYSYYHSECDYCKKHKEKVKENLIVGFRTYPPGKYPKKTYKQRKKDWEQFKCIP